MEGEVGGQDRDERPEATCLPLRPLIPNPLLITSIRLQVHPLHFLYVIDVFVTQTHTHTGLRIRIRSDPVFLHGSGSGFQISLDPDPDPVFKFLWIRIRFQPRFWNKKKIAERSLKTVYSPACIFCHFFLCGSPHLGAQLDNFKTGGQVYL